jgi:hypothetical protein
MDVQEISGVRNKSKLYYVRDSNSVFILKCKSGRKIYVNCYFKKCNAKAIIEDNKLHAVNGKEIHSAHDCEISSLLAKFNFYEELRSKSSSVFGVELKSIYDEIYVKYDLQIEKIYIFYVHLCFLCRYKPELKNIIITYPSVMSSMKRWRSANSNIPKSPKSIDEILSQMNSDSIRNRFSIDSEYLVHEVPSSLNSGITIAMYTKSMIDNVKENQTRLTAFLDGTFGFCSGLFSQLFIVHLNVKKYVSIYSASLNLLAFNYHFNMILGICLTLLVYDKKDL